VSLRDLFSRRAKKPTTEKRRLHRKTLIVTLLTANFIIAPEYPPDIIQHIKAAEEGFATGDFSAVARKPPKDVQFAPYAALPAPWRRVIDQSATAAELKDGAELYNRLPPAYKAGLLNLIAKSEATRLPDGSTVLDHLQRVSEIQQDRIFVEVDPALPAQLDASTATGVFYKRSGLDGSLHAPPKDFRKYASYKTNDARGELDITLSSGGGKWVAELDIDYYRGMRHLFMEVVYHRALHEKTDPFKVEKILRDRQGIDPGYKPK
jgi:hypothetical protein